jgi:peptidoglycan biosynthesis protein MviN/MurJ (putative lipid II flippase)
VGNLVATCVNAVAEVALAFWMHAQVAAYKTQYLTTVDFTELRRRLERRGTYTDSTFWFDIHTLVFVLLIIAAVLLIVNFIWKKRLMQGEKALLQGGKAVSA